MYGLIRPNPKRCDWQIHCTPQLWLHTSAFSLFLICKLNINAGSVNILSNEVGLSTALHNYMPIYNSRSLTDLHSNSFQKHGVISSGCTFVSVRIQVQSGLKLRCFPTFLSSSSDLQRAAKSPMIKQPNSKTTIVWSVACLNKLNVISDLHLIYQHGKLGRKIT